MIRSWELEPEFKKYYYTINEEDWIEGVCYHPLAVVYFLSQEAFYPFEESETVLYLPLLLYPVPFPLMRGYKSTILTYRGVRGEKYGEDEISFEFIVF